MARKPLTSSEIAAAIRIANAFVRAYRRRQRLRRWQMAAVATTIRVRPASAPLNQRPPSSPSADISGAVVSPEGSTVLGGDIEKPALTRKRSLRRTPSVKSPPGVSSSKDVASTSGSNPPKALRRGVSRRGMGLSRHASMSAMLAEEKAAEAEREAAKRDVVERETAKAEAAKARVAAADAVLRQAAQKKAAAEAAAAEMDTAAVERTHQEMSASRASAAQQLQAWARGTAVRTHMGAARRRLVSSAVASSAAAKQAEIDEAEAVLAAARVEQATAERYHALLQMQHEHTQHSFDPPPPNLSRSEELVATLEARVGAPLYRKPGSAITASSRVMPLDMPRRRWMPNASQFLAHPRILPPSLAVELPQGETAAVTPPETGPAAERSHLGQQQGGVTRPSSAPPTRGGVGVTPTDHNTLAMAIKAEAMGHAASRHALATRLAFEPPMGSASEPVAASGAKPVPTRLAPSPAAIPATQPVSGAGMLQAPAQPLATLDSSLNPDAAETVVRPAPPPRAYDGPFRPRPWRDAAILSSQPSSARDAPWRTGSKRAQRAASAPATPRAAVAQSQGEVESSFMSRTLTVARKEIMHRGLHALPAAICFPHYRHRPPPLLALFCPADRALT